MNWSPEPSISGPSAETKPSKPSKPSSEGFDGLTSADSPEIAPAFERVDDQTAEASMKRLEVSHISIAVLDDGTMRIVQGQLQTRRAIKDGFTIYSPKDMYHFVQLGPHERRLLHSFKKRFGGSVEWKSNRAQD